MNPVIFCALLKLSEAERIHLAQDLWNSIPADEAQARLRKCTLKST
jgi:putative addiction module component (TIGR02574 family)